MGTGQQPQGTGSGQQNILRRRKLAEKKETKQGRDALKNM